MSNVEIHSVDAAISRVRAFVRRNNWSRHKLATEAGIRESVIRFFHDEHWNPTAHTLRRLEAVIPADFTSNDEAA